jgi:hypothetical protein
MKIVIDKISSDPTHSVSKKDIETVIKHIPKDWYGIKTIFKISSQLYKNSNWDRPVIENGITYLIMSRGFDRDYIIKELLIEIAANNTDISYPLRDRHINKLSRKKLDEIIQPIYNKIVVDFT